MSSNGNSTNGKGLNNHGMDELFEAAAAEADPELDALAIASADESEGEMFNVNQLHDLANAAMQRGLILGHGHHKGQYELIQRGEVFTMPMNEAMEYLQDLLRE
jgi:hypothetical protein